MVVGLIDFNAEICRMKKDDFIQPHQVDWKKEFDIIKSKLQDTLQDYNVDIQHVGSTAVPGLIAKPILDIDIIIDDKRVLPEITKELENLGYTYQGELGIKGRFAFKQNSGYLTITEEKVKWMEHHLYVCYSDSLGLKNHLLFRDALLNDAELVKAYGLLKASLVKENGMMREEYSKRKTDFIIEALKNLGFDESELEEIRKANV